MGKQKKKCVELHCISLLWQKIWWLRSLSRLAVGFASLPFCLFLGFWSSYSPIWILVRDRQTSLARRLWGRQNCVASISGKYSNCVFRSWESCIGPLL